MCEHPCNHIIEYKNKFGTKEYEAIQGFLVVRIREGSLDLSTQVCCSKCQKIDSRLHACMSCSFLGCYGKCLQNHALEKNHYFAAELLYGNIYCFLCKDYIYEEAFEDIAEIYSRLSCKTYKYSKPPEWKPSRGELQRIKESGGLKKCPSGLKGIASFSNVTCYMNCILQVFVHSSILRSYFLSDFHSTEKCLESCIMCEMKNMFQEFFGENEHEKVMPAKVFYSMLHIIEPDLFDKTKTETIRPEQKDALEFYTGLIRGLLESSSETNKTILNHIFQGEIHKEYFCQDMSCQQHTQKKEEFLNVHLYLGEGTLSKKLTELLDITYNTDPHVLDTDLKCQKCNKSANPYCREKIWKLPYVLCFTTSRIKIVHSKGEKIQSKVHTPVDFPDVIDMKPYLCEGKEDKVDSTLFSLYAVVVHGEGKNNKNEVEGHYRTYVRHSKYNWYLCDDEYLCQVDKKTVFSEVVFSGVYLLFYQRG